MKTWTLVRIMISECSNQAGVSATIRWIMGVMTLPAPFDRITIEPSKLSGQPCIRGLRITVRRVLELLATYPDRAELLREYPDLTEADLQQALAFAAAAVDGTIDVHIDAA